MTTGPLVGYKVERENVPQTLIDLSIENVPQTLIDLSIEIEERRFANRILKEACAPTELDRVAVDLIRAGTEDEGVRAMYVQFGDLMGHQDYRGALALANKVLPNGRRFREWLKPSDLETLQSGLDEESESWGARRVGVTSGVQA